MQELEKKKGKPKEKPKLTKKQEEVLQAQLQKESEIRAKLTVVSICMFWSYFKYYNIVIST